MFDGFRVMKHVNGAVDSTRKVMNRILWNMTSMEDGKRYWLDWYAWGIYSSMDAMKDVARLMKVHLTSIMNYFTNHITNAKAEGINSKIAPIVKRAFGYRKREN